MKCQLSKSNIDELFDYVLKETDHFRIFDPRLLKMRPESILIFRLLLQKSQKEFCKMTGLSKGGLWAYELKKSGIHSKTANKAMKKLEFFCRNIRFSCDTV